MNERLSNLVMKYVGQFGEFPPVPATYSLANLEEMMEDALISNERITQEQIFEQIKASGVPFDLVK